MKRRFLKGDALLAVDLINAFAGKNGEIPVDGTEDIVDPHNKLVQEFLDAGCPVFDAHDEHPKVSKHFKEFGGPWDEHGIKGTWSAEFLPGYFRDPRIQSVPKGTTGKDNGYSGFDDTNLHELLQEQEVRTLYVDGVATDYCVLETVRKALELGYKVIVLVDLIRAADINPGDGERALQEMQSLGATLMESKDIPYAEV